MRPSPSPDQRVRTSLVPWRWLVKLLLIGVPVIVIGVFVFASSAPRICKVHMLVDLDPNRALVAERLAKEAQRHGLEVELSQQAYGALEAIKLVDEPNPIDLALVPGGVARGEYANVRQVAALSQEPLQLLARPEVAAKDVGGLKGRRVCIGPPTSSTYFIARDVLAFAGMRASAPGRPGDYVTEETSPRELSQQLNGLRDLSGSGREKALHKLPDAIFLLSSLPSILARDLVEVGGYRLVPLPFADAYCLDRIRPSETDQVRIDRATFAAVDIPPYTYSVDPPIPDKPCRTIATRLLLIAYAPSDPEGVARLSETVFDGAIAGLVDPLPLKGHAPQFPLHSGAERYMRRSEPLLSPELMGALGKAAGGLGALVSGFVAFYSFLRLRQLRRFEAYYKEIRRLELIARGQEDDPAAPIEPEARRAYLEERLLDLKSRALQDFANGGLRGEGLMFGIVGLVNDTRASLVRLHLPAGHEPEPEAGHEMRRVGSS
jgi:NMT1 family protein